MDDYWDLPPTYARHNLLHQDEDPYQLPDQVSRSRKRSREYDPTFSSDPAFFSSDDYLDTSADDYLQGNRKKKYRGTWWDKQAVEEPQLGNQPRKLEFKRNTDSGIWVDEDETQDLMNKSSLTMPPSTFQVLSKSLSERNTKRPPSDLTLAVEDSPSSGVYKRTELTDERPESAEAIESRRKTTVFYPDVSDAPNAAAARIIDLCVESGNELVDLSDLHLRKIDNSTLRPLSFLLKHTDHSQGIYEAFRPILYICLANNLLQSLPSGLFNLENVTVLSLRNNELTELPPIFDRMVTLRELNLSGNALRFLPFEIMALIRSGMLENLTLGTNPLVKVDKTSMLDSNGDLIEGYLPLITPTAGKPWMPRILAATPVTYFGIDSTRLRASPVAPSLLAKSQKLFSAAPPFYVPTPPVSSSWSSAPSLVELALRSCTSFSDMNELSEMLSLDGLEVLPNLIREAESSKSTGGKKCSVCGKKYILARTEWIESYIYLEQDAYGPHPVQAFYGQLPLLRRGCSWRCVPTGGG